MSDDDHSDVTGALEDLRCATLRARAPTLERRPLVHERLDDVQVVCVELVVVLGVGDCRLEHLRDVTTNVTGGELEEDTGVLDAVVTDVVDDQARLARRRADVACGCADERRLSGDGVFIGTAFLAAGFFAACLLGRGLLGLSSVASSDFASVFSRRPSWLPASWPQASLSAAASSAAASQRPFAAGFFAAAGFSALASVCLCLGRLRFRGLVSLSGLLSFFFCHQSLYLTLPLPPA